MLLNNKKFLILGSNGQLGNEFQSILTKKNLSFQAPNKSDGNIADFQDIKNYIQRVHPDIIINCAAYNAVDDAEDHPDLAYLINSAAVENLAKICEKQNIFFVHYSSDYVFDGGKTVLYTEEDTPNPLNIYGQSKLKGEQIVLKTLSKTLVFRLSWVIGQGQYNFLYKLSQWAKNSQELKISSDEISVPTFTKDIVEITLLSLEKDLTGLYHLTNSGQASRYELAEKFIQKMNLNNTLIPVSMDTFPTKAKRPKFSAMSNQKISKELNIRIPNWKERILNYDH